MTRNQIIAIQKKIGTEPDGIWGRESIRMCEAYLRGLMPKNLKWPKPDDASMHKFYGEPGDINNLVNASVAGLGVRYFGTPVKTVRCHKLVADSLVAALDDIASGPYCHILMEYAGCFNFRPMRGGTRYSKHAWGVAIDLLPSKNGLHTHWPSKATMPFEVMEAFARQGWVGLGWAIHRDAMHFEATAAT